MSYKPEGYPSLAPYLVVPDAHRVIGFLTATFQATVARVFEREDGSVMHAELRLDDSIVMLGQAAESWPPVPCHLHVYVPDVDATYANAVENGGEPVQEPAKRDDPDRRGGVKGPGGNTWWISTQVG